LNPIVRDLVGLPPPKLQAAAPERLTAVEKVRWLWSTRAVALSAREG